SPKLSHSRPVRWNLPRAGDGPLPSQGHEDGMETAGSGCPGRLRRRGIGAPFEPAAVIDRDIVLAEQMRAKGDDGCGHAAAAGGDERLVEIDPGGIERRLQLVAALPGAVGVEQLAVRQAARIRTVAVRE